MIISNAIRETYRKYHVLRPVIVVDSAILSVGLGVNLKLGLLARGKNKLLQEDPVEDP